MVEKTADIPEVLALREQASNFIVEIDDRIDLGDYESTLEPYTRLGATIAALLDVKRGKTVFESTIQKLRESIDPFRRALGVKEVRKYKTEEVMHAIGVAYGTNLDMNNFEYPDQVQVLREVYPNNPKGKDIRLQRDLSDFCKSVKLNEPPTCHTESYLQFLDQMRIHPFGEHLNVQQLFELGLRFISFQEALDISGLTLEEFKSRMISTFGTKIVTKEEVEASDIALKEEPVVLEEKTSEPPVLEVQVAPIPETREAVDLSVIQEEALIKGLEIDPETKEFVYLSVFGEVYKEKLESTKKLKNPSLARNKIADEWFVERVEIIRKLRDALAMPIEELTPRMVHLISYLSNLPLTQELAVSDIDAVISRSPIKSVEDLQRLISDPNRDVKGLRFGDHPLKGVLLKDTVF